MKCSTCQSDLTIYGPRCCACRRDALVRVLANYSNHPAPPHRVEVGWLQAENGIVRKCGAIKRDGDGHRDGVSFDPTQP